MTCYLLLTSNEFDRTIRIVGSGNYFGSEGPSTSFDNKGNQYFPSTVTISNSEGTAKVDKKLVAGLTTEATIVFEGLSTLSTSFSQLDLDFRLDEKNHRAKFDNVAF